MTESFEVTAALTLALALAAAVVTQTIARHVRIPAIALLMGTGLVLGPDVLDIVRPEALGEGLPGLVGMAVAIILFEGGMGLNFRELRRQNRPIRLLVAAGPLVTTAGGALAARFLLGWEWSQALLFGTLVIVTGPTVIQPLLRRIRVNRRVRTILEAEAVFIDAVGATVAVVALSLVTQPQGSLSGAFLLFAEKMGFGVLAGAAGGLLIALLLKSRHLVPEGLENIFTLSLVLALYQVSHAIFPESGIAAVTVAGLVVGNIQTRVLNDLKEFKEQLTVMMIGLLFVLLAADVRLVEVTDLGWAGVTTVAVLMLIVRPLTVIIATWRSDLTRREVAFVAWIGPRGIVAAAVASLFAEELAVAGLEGGLELRALVFLTIAMTVIVQGLSSGFVARVLGLRRAADSGFVILGANALGIGLGKALADGGEEVLFMDANPHHSRQAEAQGFRSIFGNALEQRPLQLAEIDTRIACIGLTPNEQMNLLFVRKAREEFGAKRAYIAKRATDSGITAEMIHEGRAALLFGGPRDLAAWSTRLDQGMALVEPWRWDPPRLNGPTPAEVLESLGSGGSDRVLPLAFGRGGRTLPMDDSWEPRRGDLVFLAVVQADAEAQEAWLTELGWKRQEPSAELAPV